MTTGKETETMSQEYDKMMRQFADKYRHVCVANNSIDAKLFEQLFKIKYQSTIPSLKLSVSP